MPASGVAAPPAVEVRDLVKRYRKADVNAVDGISFAVAPGEFFALLGPNGAGKTTTISILTTTLRPTSGSVVICGHDLDSDAAAVRRQSGIIFQNPSLDMNLTGEENVRLHAVLYGLVPYRFSYRLMPASYRKQLRDLAEILGMGDDIFKPVKKLSGGMRRKLEIIRSLMHRPKVLFLDEPSTGLDATSRRGLWAHLESVRREHEVTIFLTTHYLEEAEESDRVCILNHGSVVALGTPAEVTAQLVDEYLEIDATDRDALRAELTRRNLTFTEDGYFKVRVDKNSTASVAQTIETPLTLLRTHLPSLEDAYLRIVSNE